MTLHDVSSGVADPIAYQFGTPDTAFEFETSSLSGLTALSPTPDVENANATVPGCYFVQDNASGVALCGRYISAPAAPFSAIARLLDSDLREDFNRAALFIGQGTPGILETAGLSWNGSNARRIQVDRWTNPTTYDSTPGTMGGQLPTAIYLGIRVNSSTSVDYLWSLNGRIWMKPVAARDPSITIGSVGILMNALNANGAAVAFDFFRVWNSAKTFPGA